MAILDEIDRRLKQDPEFNEFYGESENPVSNLLDDRPFVKNIENVQGDEHDIIIFSGYARIRTEISVSGLARLTKRVRRIVLMWL